MAKRRNNTPMKVRRCACFWIDPSNRDVECGRPSMPLSMTPSSHFTHKTTQRFTHLVTTTYTYVRPAAYYGFIPFVLYVGMMGDAAPR